MELSIFPIMPVRRWITLNKSFGYHLAKDIMFKKVSVNVLKLGHVKVLAPWKTGYVPLIAAEFALLKEFFSQ